MGDKKKWRLIRGSPRNMMKFRATTYSTLSESLDEYGTLLNLVYTGRHHIQCRLGLFILFAGKVREALIQEKKVLVTQAESHRHEPHTIELIYTLYKGHCPICTVLCTR